jgi:hypothetical protein
MTGRGRPKGTKKLPRDYYILLMDVYRRIPSGVPLRQWCVNVCKRGGVEFIGADFWPVGRISDPDTLRTRMTEAKLLQRQTNYRTRTFPNALRGPLTMYMYGGLVGSRAMKSMEDAVTAAAARRTFVWVPPPKQIKKLHK